jgi:hypothetical protein
VIDRRVPQPRGNEVPPEIFRRENLRVFLRKHWEEKGEEVSKERRIGIEIADLVELSRARNDGIDAPYLELWVEILDELNSWMISLLSVVYASPTRQATMNDFERSVVMILAKLISDTTAMRHLVNLGFDNSARTLLRSIAEYMQVLVAIIDDSALAAEFVKADTPETSNKFYFDYLARQKLNRRVLAAWTRFFGSKDGAASFFAHQQRELAQVLAGTAHPSFAGGFLSVLHFIEAEEGESWLGHWGAKSNLSVLTISIFTTCFMPLLLLSKFPFEGYDDRLSLPIPYDPTDEMHRHVEKGRSVLASLILSLSKESNIPHIFPDGLEPEIAERQDGGSMVHEPQALA